MDVESLVAEFRRELPFYLRCSEVTARKSAYQVAKYFRQNPGQFPETFTRERIVEYLREMASTPPLQNSPGKGKTRREPSTVNDILKSLRRFARWCVAREFLATDPTEKLRGLAETDRVILAPEVATVVKLIRAAADHGETPEIKARNQALVYFLSDTGVRAAEALSVDLRDVWNGRQVVDTFVVHGKGAKDRLAPIRPELQEVVARYLRLRRAARGETALWVDVTGYRMSYVALRNMVRELCKAQGERVNLHDFRRFYHTELWKSGINLVDGMALSGHVLEKDYRLYIRRAIQERAVEEARKYDPLQALVSAAD